MVRNRSTPLPLSKGPSHYRQGSIEPIEYITANRLDFCEGNVIKYVTRWRHKNGLEDLEKAKHYLEFLIATHIAEAGAGGQGSGDGEK